VPRFVIINRLKYNIILREELEPNHEIYMKTNCDHEIQFMHRPAKLQIKLMTTSERQYMAKEYPHKKVFKNLAKKDKQN
jgi:hypothetical protein